MFRFVGIIAMMLALAPAMSVGAELDALSIKLFQAQQAQANKGSAQDQYHLAEMYEKGLGTEQDFNKARDWYKKAAAQGHDRAAEKLANWDRTVQEATMTIDQRAASIGRGERERREAEARAAAEAAAAARARKEAEAKAKAAAAAKAKPAPKPAPKPVAAAKPGAKAAAKDGDDAEFNTNPCKGPTAKFLSTCK